MNEVEEKREKEILSKIEELQLIIFRYDTHPFYEHYRYTRDQAVSELEYYNKLYMENL